MKRIVLFILAAAVAVSASFAASTKHWQEEFRAAESEMLQRNFDAAAKILEDSATEARELGVLTSGKHSFALAGAYEELQQPEKALAVMNSGLERIGPNPRPRELQLLRGLFLAGRSYIYFDQGQPDTALTNAIQAHDVLEMITGRDNPQFFRIYTLIGNIQMKKKNYAEAEKALKSALKLAEMRQIAVRRNFVNGGMTTYQLPELNDGVVWASSALGELNYEQAKYPEAEKAYRTALSHSEARLGKNSPLVVMPVVGLAKVEFKQGRRKDFERDTARVCKLAMANPGYPPMVLLPLWLKLRMDVNETNSPAAKETAQQIAKICTAQHFDSKVMAEGAKQLSVAADVVDWPKLTSIAGILKEAARAEHPGDDSYLVPMYAEIARFATERQRNEIALETYLELAESQANAADKGTLMSALSKVAEVQTGLGKKSDALETYRKVTQLLRAKYGDDSRVADSLERDAALMKELGRDNDAKATLADAAEVRKRGLAK